MSVWIDCSPVALKGKISHFCNSLHTTRRTADLLLSSQVNVKFTQKYSSEAETIRAQAQDPAPAAVQAVPLNRVTE